MMNVKKEKSKDENIMKIDRFAKQVDDFCESMKNTTAIVAAVFKHKEKDEQVPGFIKQMGNFHTLQAAQIAIKDDFVKRCDDVERLLLEHMPLERKKKRFSDWTRGYISASIPFLILGILIGLFLF